MRKKLLGVLLGAVMAVSLAACGGSSGAAKIESTDSAPAATAEATTEEAQPTEAADEDFHIGIVTGSVSQSEDDRRGAEAFQAKYGEENVILAIYPDNFTEELETTIQTIVNLSDDPKMKAIIVNPSSTRQSPARQKLSVRSRRRGLTSSASPASPTRTFPRSAPLQTWSSTTTLSPAAI